MQTHGDKRGSFDLLQEEIKEEDEHSNESNDNISAHDHFSINSV
jgi:hypothetical protein